jgi:2-polyprenyl-3-methyl-5-hydroxy-6-metoxy-1,4-benzoquinol methylase
MSVQGANTLDSILAGRPSTLRVVNISLTAWPEHEKYLIKSFGQRTAETLEATEEVAAAVLRLIAGAEKRFGEDYHWTCDRLREEEIYFHREGRYRLSTFAEALAEVYSDHEYMRHYMGGLLLTQVLWFNHIATMDMFLRRALDAMTEPFDYLEVGPGHGLMTYFAAKSEFSRSLEAWDVSSESLRQTRAALDRLEVSKSIALVETDILGGKLSPKRFDLVVISEVLEHLETPSEALRFLRSAISGGGRIFINVPINSPSPDHLYLFSSPEDVIALIEDAGLHVNRMELYATQGHAIEKALANRISVSAGVIALPR